MGLVVNGIVVMTNYNFVTKTVTGRGLPAVEHTVIEMPCLDGAIHKRSRIPPRTLQVVGYVFGKTEDEAKTKRDNFLSFISSAATQEITLTFPDTMRSIKVRLAGSTSDFVSLGPAYKAYAYQITLNFIAHDPYFFVGSAKYLTG